MVLLRLENITDPEHRSEEVLGRDDVYVRRTCYQRRALNENKARMNHTVEA